MPRRVLSEAASELRSSPVTAGVLAAALAIEALLLALHGANKLLLDDGRMLALDREWNLPTAFSAVQFLMAAAVCAVAAGLATRARLPLLMLTAIAAGLALDEIAQVHERFEEQVGGDLAIKLIEPLAGLAVLAVFWLAARGLPSLSRVLLLGAAAALVAAQGASVLNAGAELPYAAVVTLQAGEEIAEMLVGTLILAALAAPALEARRASALPDLGWAPEPAARSAVPGPSSTHTSPERPAGP